MHPAIAGLTSTQLGLVTRDQLAKVPLSSSNVLHLVASGRLEWMTPRVLILVGTPVTQHALALSAVLDSDGVLSSRSAAALWGAPGYKLLPAHVTRCRGGRVRKSHSGVIHELRELHDGHKTTYMNIPVLRPARVLFDLAATEHQLRVERTLDWMWSRRLVTIPALDRTLEQVAARGRKGVAAMRELIEARRGLPPVGSNLETRFHEVAKLSNLPPFDRQVDLGDEQEWLGRVDFVSTTRLLVIEVDSEIHHSALSDQKRDAKQRQRLEDVGFMVRVLREDDLFHQRARTIGYLRSWYNEARPR
ncbi:MAG: DUF559 domain-containing protein [Microthrixaceae bacterium]